MNRKPKSLNSLMKYMRDEKGINIAGNDKKKLRQIGYFHGYKGYRYCNEPSVTLPYDSFKQLLSVYNFDSNVKALMYPKMMFLETAIKNSVLEVLLNYCKSASFADIYSVALTDYKSYTAGNNKYREAYRNRLRLRDQIHDLYSKHFDGKIIRHYINKDEQVPIWAIFELLSLGEFATLIKCCGFDVRSEISSQLGIRSSYDPERDIITSMLFLLKDLRNSIAHNSAVFDARYRSGSVSNKLITYLQRETGIANITFDTIVDYIIIMTYLMKLLGSSKTELKSFVNQYVVYSEQLRESVPTSIYNRINHTDTKKKIENLNKFIKNK